VDETANFQAFVLRRHIVRTKEELEQAKLMSKKLSTEFSIDIPIQLIPHLYVAFAYIYKMQGGQLQEDRS